MIGFDADSAAKTALIKARLKSIDEYDIMIEDATPRRVSYSSSPTDTEWKSLEPLSWCAFPSAAKQRGVASLLPEVLPPKKSTRPLDWSYRALTDGILYRLKNGDKLY